VKEQGLDTEFILETHVHADHLTASQYLKMKLGGGGGGGGGGPKVCIGEHISAVQRHFAAYFGLVDFPTDGFASPPTPLLNLNIPRSSYPAWVRGCVGGGLIAFSLFGLDPSLIDCSRRETPLILGLSSAR